MLTNILKFILGFTLAIAVLIGGGLTVALYFINRTGIAPAKPIFANDYPPEKTYKPKLVKAETSSIPKLKLVTQLTPTPTPTPSTTPTPSAEKLPAGAYRARVIWPEGLRLRAEPTEDAERVGGVSGNQKIIVLQETSDKAWQKIRVEGSNQEGWVKSANTEKLNDQ
jgi:hypothetical protein